MSSVLRRRFSVSVKIKRIFLADDLTAICEQMQPDLWGRDNDISSWQPETLKQFLQQNGHLLLACAGDKIAGAALCYDMPPPAAVDRSFYVNELDTHPDFRRQGIGTLLMQEAFKLGKELGASEVWVATETDNDAANGLYTKLQPYEIEQSITYS